MHRNSLTVRAASVLFLRGLDAWHLPFRKKPISPSTPAEDNDTAPSGGCSGCGGGCSSLFGLLQLLLCPCLLESGILQGFLGLLQSFFGLFPPGGGLFETCRSRVEPGSQRAQRSKKRDLDRNFQSRSKFLISLENFNLDVSISPQKIGPRWVARSKISFSIEIFNLDRNLEFF